MPSETGMYFWHDRDRLILIVTGRVTATEAYSIDRHLAEWLSDNPTSTVLLDMHRTDYIDSTAIGMLVRLHKRQGKRGGRLILCNLSATVAEIIERTRLTHYFSIIDDEALQRLEGEALGQIPRAAQAVDAQFVLDAHHDICAIVPELKPQFETLMRVLESTIDGV